MSTEMPIGLSRLRGDDGLFEDACREEDVSVNPPRGVGEWDFSTRAATHSVQIEPVGLGRMSLVPKEQKPVIRPLFEAEPQVASQALPQVTPLDKGEAMEVLLELSQVLLQENNPARRRERWIVVRQKLENLMNQA